MMHYNTFYRPEGTCLWCQHPLELRHNRRTHDRFLGCANYPRCTFTVPYDDYLQFLGRAWEHHEAEISRLAQCLRVLQAQVETPRQSMSRELRRLVGLCHPDKWHQRSGIEVAEVCTKELLALRDRVEGGQL